MIIGVDAGSLAVQEEKQKLGVYQMTFNLLEELGRIDKKNQYWLYSFAPIEEEILDQFGPRMKNIIASPTFGWRYFGLPFGLFLNKPDVFWGLSQALPVFCPCSAVVIVHDLAFEHFPECYPRGGERLKRLTHHAVLKASKIIAVSKATKEDLINIYQMPEEKIKVIYEGYDSIFKPQGKRQVEQIKRKYKIGGSYFLFVGALKKVKNIPRILTGFARFSKKSKKDFRLVLVGGDIEQDKEISKQIKRLSLEEKVMFLGYVPREDLPGLYSGARAFVSPSLYEGFGLPLLEAMACETPVITSNTGSMPEVVGNVALLVNPQGTREIAQAMERLASNTALYCMLKKRGLERVEMFSWKKFASGVLKILEKHRLS